MKKKRGKLKIKRVLIFILSLALVGYIIYSLLDMPVKNIEVKGVDYLSDWEVIKLAKLDNYPSILTVNPSKIKKRLEKNNYIISATVKSNFISKITINIEENYPIFYDSTSSTTVLKDGTIIPKKESTTYLTNTVSANMYKTLIKKMGLVNKDILTKISEITYFPDSVDDERFYLLMTDGNYVYLTLKKFYLINDYNSYVKEFGTKKGVLYLNSGGYFKIIEN